MLFFLFALLPIGGLCSPAGPVPNKAVDPTLATATIDSGVILGTTTSLPSATAVVNKFMGIPFAAKPERFAPPQKQEAWSAPLDTQIAKPACIQQFNYPEASRNFAIEVFNSPSPEESEDCLYLNVWTSSAPAPPDGRAVMFWIYGGSLQFGSGGQPGYDGSAFAAYEDVVLVTTNYRTNVFGFPSSPELPKEGHNLGFLDQRAALDWVQRNVHTFGGDPKKVTIFGESAGGFSVDALLTSYPKGSEPPFRAAILQSGQISVRPSQTPASTESWTKLAAGLNCTGNATLPCVKAAPASAIKDVIEHQALSFNPSVDDVTLVSNPELKRRADQIAHIPTLSGTVAQEGRALSARGQTNITQYVQTTFSAYEGLPEKVLAAYPLGTPGLETATDAIPQIFTEYFFQCAEQLWANDAAKAGIPTWRYYFNATFPNLQAFPGAGIYHSSEIGLVFRTYGQKKDDVSQRPSTPQENALATYMQSTWARFAKNPTAGPGWAAVGSAAEDVAALGTGKSSGATLIRQEEIDERCELFRPMYEKTIAGS